MSAFEWRPLADEIARWRERGLALRLWLRDDDASQPTPALERLIAVSRRHERPLLLAVIPARAGPALAARLAHEHLILPCQHGFAHVNHAPAGEKKSELGAHRPLDMVLAELAAGRDRMRTLFGARTAPILVPPWNRIAPALVDALPQLGFAALSCFGPAVSRPPPLQIINCDLDIINWRGGRVSFPPAELTRQLVAQLADARGRGGASVGVLLHHLIHDENAWIWLDGLCAQLHDTAIAWSPSLAPTTKT